MYESETFEVILRRTLQRVSAKFDKREGSMIYDPVAACSVEFQNNYISIDVILNELFPDTASREYLIKHCADKGLIPKPASYATVTGRFTPATVEIPIGSRYSHEDLNYTVTEKIEDGLYYLQCETIGSEPNGVTGQLIPIDYVNGLQTAEIIEVTFIGEDEEETEALRARYMKSTDSEQYGGNEIDYETRIKSISRVGQVKLYRGAEWNGGGTVKAVITDSDNCVPSPELVDTVQKIIDPELPVFDGNVITGTPYTQLAGLPYTLEDDGTQYSIGSGDGKGIAPIGHFVTIVGAYKTPINITCTLNYKSGFSWANVKTNVETAIDNYFATLNAKWEDLDKIRVRIAYLESYILDVEGVVDVQNTTINGKAENLALDKDALAIRGTINEN